MLGARGVGDGFFDAHLFHQIDFVGVVKVDGFAFGSDGSRGGALVAQFLGEGAGVDAGNQGNALGFEPVSERGLCLPVAEVFGVFAHDHAFEVDGVAFKVFLKAAFVLFPPGHAVIAHQWKGEDEDLIFVGGVGETFGVAHHAGIENHFAGGAHVRAKRPSRQACAVLEGKGEREFGVRHPAHFSQFEAICKRPDSNAPLVRWKRKVSDGVTFLL